MKKRDLPLKRHLLSAAVDVTAACNLRCEHCIVSADKPAKNELSLKDYGRLAHSFAKLGCNEVGLTGGEPLLRTDWDKIASIFIEAGFRVSLNTNGWLIDDRVVKKIKRLGIFGVGVSIDGPKTLHDKLRVHRTQKKASSYERAVDAILMLVDANIQVSVSTVLNNANIPLLEDIWEHLKDMGVTVWNLQLLSPGGRAVDMDVKYLPTPSILKTLIPTLAKLYQRKEITLMVGDNIGYFHRLEVKMRYAPKGQPGFFRGCQAGLVTVGIRADGSVTGCLSLPPSFNVGNIKESRLEDIWMNENNFGYNTRFDENALMEQCANCVYKRICRAGCTSMAYNTTGTVHANPFCVHAAQQSATQPQNKEK